MKVTVASQQNVSTALDNVTNYHRLIAVDDALRQAHCTHAIARGFLRILSPAAYLF
jgi:hypothetical protein